MTATAGSGQSVVVRWQLSVSNLSGPIRRATLQTPGPTKITFALCKPCGPKARGQLVLLRSMWNRIARRRCDRRRLDARAPERRAPRNSSSAADAQASPLLEVDVRAVALAVVEAERQAAADVPPVLLRLPLVVVDARREVLEHPLVRGQRLARPDRQARGAVDRRRDRVARRRRCPCRWRRRARSRPASPSPASAGRARAAGRAAT